MPGTSFDLIQSAMGRPARRSRLPPRSDGRRASQGRHKALSLSLASRPPQAGCWRLARATARADAAAYQTPPDLGFMFVQLMQRHRRAKVLIAASACLRPASPTRAIAQP